MAMARVEACAALLARKAGATHNATPHGAGIGRCLLQSQVGILPESQVWLSACRHAPPNGLPAFRRNQYAEAHLDWLQLPASNVSRAPAHGPMHPDRKCLLGLQHGIPPCRGSDGQGSFKVPPTPGPGPTGKTNVASEPARWMPSALPISLLFSAIEPGHPARSSGAANTAISAHQGRKTSHSQHPRSRWRRRRRTPPGLDGSLNHNRNAPAALMSRCVITSAACGPLYSTIRLLPTQVAAAPRPPASSATPPVNTSRLARLQVDARTNNPPPDQTTSDSRPAGWRLAKDAVLEQSQLQQG
ncbi:hypothetical protein FQR65_LT17935 [Abscondita terminalis]|nr:hypothetical protein FQR65_LT17935 [Abscondita terminalis]